jgi:phenylacetate-CoA ligase
MDYFGSILKRFVYPLVEWRDGTTILSWVGSLERTQWIAPEALQKIRFQKLQQILRHAFNKTEFYKKRFLDAGITPDDIHGFEDLPLIPPLTKDDIVGNLEVLAAKGFSPAEIHRDASGGSTGRHTPFYRNNECLNIKLAAQYRFNKWTGWDFGDKVAMVWPALQDFSHHQSFKSRIRQAWVDRLLMLYAGSLNESVVAQYCKRLSKFRPTLIRAFPNPLSILAKYLDNTPQCKIHPHGIVTVGEPLLSSQRILFEKVFQCPIFNCYVSRECGHIASECEMHSGLHINADCLHIEFVQDGKPVSENEAGQILITDFENYGMPFIRYSIGDYGKPMPGLCQCGRTLPRMDFDAGRISDFIYSPHDGSLISGASLCHHLIVEGPDVGQLQLVQESCNHLTIRIRTNQKDSFINENSEHIKQVISRIFHGKMRLTLELVDTISHEKSGKYRFCINRYLESKKSE